MRVNTALVDTCDDAVNATVDTERTTACDASEKTAVGVVIGQCACGEIVPQRKQDHDPSK